MCVQLATRVGVCCTNSGRSPRGAQAFGMAAAVASRTGPSQGGDTAYRKMVSAGDEVRPERMSRHCCSWDALLVGDHSFF